MADRMRDSAGWLLETVTTELEGAVRWMRARSNPDVTPVAQPDPLPTNVRVQDHGMLHITCTRYDRNVYVQIIAARRPHQPRWYYIMSDSESSIQAMITPECEKQLQAKLPGRDLFEAAVGAVIAIREFDIVGRPGMTTKDLVFKVHKFDYFGICSQFGSNHRYLNDQLSIKEQWKTLLHLPARTWNSCSFRVVSFPHSDPSTSPRTLEETLAFQAQVSSSVDTSTASPRYQTQTKSLLSSDATQPSTINESAVPILSEAAKQKRRDQLLGLFQSNQSVSDKKSSETPDKANTAATVTEKTLPVDVPILSPAGSTRLADLEPDEAYIFKGNFNFAKCIPTIPHDDFYREQMRLLNLREAQYPPEPGVKFAESNFPVDAVNHMRATVQKRAAYKESQQAQRMQHALQRQADEAGRPSTSQQVKDNGVEAEPSSSQLSWPDSPERMDKRQASLPPDSSAPEESPEEEQLESLKADSEDDLSDLEMQEPAALELPAHTLPVVPKKRRAEEQEVQPSTPSHDSQQQVTKRHHPTTIVSSQVERPDPRHCQTIEEYYQKFKKSYPEYTGSFKHFLSLLHQASKILPYDIDNQGLDTTIADDFVVRNFTDYIPHIKNRIAEGEDPIPYFLYYRRKYNSPKYQNDVITQHTLTLINSKQTSVGQGQETFRELSTKPSSSANRGQGSSSTAQTSPSPATKPHATKAAAAAAIPSEAEEEGESEDEGEDDDDDVTDNDDNDRLKISQSSKVSVTPDSTGRVSSSSASEGKGRRWWQKDSTAFKEFARSYGNLKSVQGVLGEVLPTGNSSNRIFEREAVTFDVLSWNLRN